MGQHHFLDPAPAGGLPLGVSEDDLHAAFGKFGKLANVWVARKPPGFGEACRFAPMYAPVGQVACLVLACPRVRPPAFGQPPPLTPCGVPALAGLTLVCALRCITSCRPACTSGHTTSPGWKAPHLHAGQDQTTHHAQPPPLLPATSAAPAQASVAPPLNSPT